MEKEPSNVPRLKPTYRLYTQCNKDAFNNNVQDFLQCEHVNI